MDHQNWEPVILHASAKTRLQTAKKEVVERKSSEAQRLSKLEREEYSKPKLLAPQSRQELVQRRLAETLTQQQLDQRCSFPPHTVRDLEANKRPPTQRELQSLNRALKCGLRLE